MDDKKKKIIVEEYMTGKRPIVDIARVHDVSVEAVLELTDNQDMLTVEMPGDIIDDSELGGQATRYHGKKDRITYTKN